MRTTKRTFIEALLAALVSGKLSMATALDRGLLVVDGEATAVESVRSLLNESFRKKNNRNVKSGKREMNGEY